ncbi:MAG: TetR family transcriptional regulator C-terminal domain-containing protein [Spirochaetes bacterium]|nr:TetR family transcriptional regulator C-terminal domain-containing protein [Spirochaetota bacterium]
MVRSIEAKRENKSNEITQIRRSQLTKATYRVVGRKGYYNFTIRDIAKEAGLSAGLVHYYFKDKQDLLLNLLREMNANLKYYLNKALSELDNPRDKLLAFCDQAFDLVQKEKDYFYVLIDFWTQINHNPRIRNANVKLFRSYREECAAILREGMEKGVFKHMDVDYVATLLISLIQGTIIQYVIDNEAFDYAEYTKRIKENIISMLEKGD